MKVLALVPHQKGHAAGQRGSIELWEKILAPEGIEVVFEPFESVELQEILYSGGHHLQKAKEMLKSYASRIRLLSSIDDYDAVFVYREAALLGPAFLEKMAARKKPIIYQLDDPLFVPYKSPSNGYLSYLKFFGKVKEIIKISKVVMVNSSYIREYAEQFNKNIWQVPSVVDTEKFVYRPHEVRPRRTCIGWSGSATTVKNIKLVERPLRTISKNGRCDIHLIGGTDFGLEGVDHTSQEWSESTEVEDLRRMQVGLVPLPDSPWNRFKFIMKTAQYMSLGIVPVGTPMASNTEVIRHGENGFLADTDEEWVKYVMMLVNDHELRTKMSETAARDAVAHYSLKANAPKVIEAFRSAVA
ncbi:MAG: glycosyltransferase family 4 protein [Acidobacteria bacterium]|nr:glycosyltransferase family 4 protein [Acidobacteriota bacterium]